MSDRAKNENIDSQTLKRLQEKYPELVAKAKQIERDGKEIHPIVSYGHWHKLGKWLKKLLTVDPQKFHGKAYLTEDLESHSCSVASMVTIANLINAGTAYPLLLLTMADMGLLRGLLATATNLGLVMFSNQAGEVAAANKPGNRVWSEVGLAGVIFLNLIQSLVSGVGTQLLLDQANISKYMADDLVREQIVDPLEGKVEEYQFNPDAIASKEKCQELETQLTYVKANTSKSSRLYSQAYGSWADSQLPLERRSYFESPPSQWPYCVRAKYEEQQYTSRLAMAEEELQEFQEAIADRGSLAYLQEQKPDVYHQHFDEEGKLKSGMEATRVAVKMFAEKLTNGDWASLGLSLYIFFLSLVTSAIAVILVATHSNRIEDVELGERLKAAYIRSQTKETEISSIESDRELAIFLSLVEANVSQSGYLPDNEWIARAKASYISDRNKEITQQLNSIDRAIANLTQGCDCMKQSITQLEEIDTQQAIAQIIRGSHYLNCIFPAQLNQIDLSEIDLKWTENVDRRNLFSLFSG